MEEPEGQEGGHGGRQGEGAADGRHGQGGGEQGGLPAETSIQRQSIWRIVLIYFFAVPVRAVPGQVDPHQRPPEEDRLGVVLVVGAVANLKQ